MKSAVPHVLGKKKNDLRKMSLAITGLKSHLPDSENPFADIFPLVRSE